MEIDSISGQNFNFTNIGDAGAHNMNGSLDFGIDSSGQDVIMAKPLFPIYLRIIATFVCVLILLVGTTGNVLVPFVVLKTKDLRNSTNIFLINLSLADLLVLVVSTPTVLAELHSQPEVWTLGESMCKFNIKLIKLPFFLFINKFYFFFHFQAVVKSLKAILTRVERTVHL